MYDFIIKKPNYSLNLQSKNLQVITPEDIDLRVSGEFSSLEFSLSFNSLYLDIIECRVKDSYKNNFKFLIKESSCSVAFTFNKKEKFDNLHILSFHVIPKKTGNTQIVFDKQKDTEYQDGSYSITESQIINNLSTCYFKSLLIN